MQYIIKIRLKPPKAGYEKVIRFLKPTRAIGTVIHNISNTAALYGILNLNFKVFATLYISDTSVENISKNIIISKTSCNPLPKGYAMYKSGISYWKIYGIFKRSIKFIIKHKTVKAAAPKVEPIHRDLVSLISLLKGTKTPVQQSILNPPYSRVDMSQGFL